MTVISFFNTSLALTQAQFNELLRLLPTSLQTKVLRFRREEDARASLFGKLLLQKMIEHFGFTASLEDLEYTKYERPYIHISDHELFDFNISHSGHYVVCAASTDMRLGIDIEKKSPIDSVDFISQFTSAEWQQIKSSSDSTSEFYRFWTRKEALAKADGRGLNFPFNQIDLAGDRVMVPLEDKQWHLKPISLSNHYECVLATGQPADSLSLFELQYMAGLEGAFQLKLNTVEQNS